MANRRSYMVTEAQDHPEDLQNQLNLIAKEDGWIISIIWQPSRSTTVGGRGTISVPSGYTIVWEQEGGSPTTRG
jgi:hypothetical protein